MLGEDLDWTTILQMLITPRRYITALKRTRVKLFMIKWLRDPAVRTSQTMSITTTDDNKTKEDSGYDFYLSKIERCNPNDAE